MVTGHDRRPGWGVPATTEVPPGADPAMDLPDCRRYRVGFMPAGCCATVATVPSVEHQPSTVGERAAVAAAATVFARGSGPRVGCSRAGGSPGGDGAVVLNTDRAADRSAAGPSALAHHHPTGTRAETTTPPPGRWKRRGSTVMADGPGGGPRPIRWIAEKPSAPDPGSHAIGRGTGFGTTRPAFTRTCAATHHSAPAVVGGQCRRFRCLRWDRSGLFGSATAGCAADGDGLRTAVRRPRVSPGENRAAVVAATGGEG